MVREGDVTGSIRLTDGQTTSAGWAMVVTATLSGTAPRPPVGIWLPLDVDELSLGRHVVFAVPHPDSSSEGRRHAGYDAAGCGAVLRARDGQLRRVCRSGVSAPVDRSLLETVLS